jgi:hypothetical protein
MKWVEHTAGLTQTKILYMKLWSTNIKTLLERYVEDNITMDIETGPG